MRFKLSIRFDPLDNGQGAREVVLRVWHGLNDWVSMQFIGNTVPFLIWCEVVVVALSVIKEGSRWQSREADYMRQALLIGSFLPRLASH